MWYRNGDWGVYWLTSAKETKPEPTLPVPHSDAIKVRRAAVGDAHWQNITDPVSGRTFYWIINKDVSDVLPEPLPPFPERPNLQNLREFMGQNDLVGVGAMDVFVATQDGISLRTNGNGVLAWYADSVHFSVSPHLAWVDWIAPIKRYLGKDFLLEKDKDLWAVKTKTSDWLPIFLGLSFNLTTLVPTYDTAWLAAATKENDIKEQRLQDYLNKITCDSIAAAAGDGTPNHNPIFTRCRSCQCCELTHLKIHMARGDIDPYLIYSAYEAYGPTQPLGGPVRLAWDLIEAARGQHEEPVKEFKKIMKAFLMPVVFPVEAFVKDVNERRPNSHKLWRANNYRLLRPTPEGGLIPAEQGGDGRRPGDDIARERAEERGDHIVRERPRGRAVFDPGPFAEIPVVQERLERIFIAQRPMPVTLRVDDEAQVAMDNEIRGEPLAENVRPHPFRFDEDDIWVDR